MGVFDISVEDAVDFSEVRAYEELPKIFDNTMLSAYRQCPRKFYWQIVRGAVPRTTATALQFGLAWHKFLELYYEGASMEKAYAEAAQLIVNPDTKRNATMLWEICKLYVERWKKDDFVVERTELGFTLELDGFLYGGRIDGIARMNNSNERFVLEHKTASRMGPFYFNQWHLSSQVRGYVYGLASLLDGVSGVLMNVAYIAKKPDLFREPIRIPPVVLEDWRRSAVDTMLNIAKSFKSGVWAQHSDGCETKYGLCPYASLCMMKQNYKEIEIPPYEFKFQRWAPYENLSNESKKEADNA